jgi:adenosylhomocysteine nucleosidase
VILVTFAVPFESAAFRRTVAGRGVRIIHTGVGPHAARAALELAVCGELPERVISSGFAGALTPELRVGDVVCDRGIEGDVRGARFASAQAVLATAREKREFRERTGADVVDMETDAIREVCAAAGVPMMALRVISDGPEDDLGLPPALLDGLAAKSPGAMLRAAWMLLRDGARRRAFLRLVRNCKAAQLALAAALERELG